MQARIKVLVPSAFVLSFLTAPFILIGVPISAVVALAAGALAGLWATGEGGESAGRRATGAVGSAVLVGSILSLAILALIAVSLPGVGEFIRMSEPHPEARIPMGMMAPTAGAAGLLTGLVVGVINLVAALVGGMVATMVRSHGAKLTA